MKSVVLRAGNLLESDMPELTPGTGQVRVKTLCCGICGSDLHAVHALESLAEMAVRSGAARTIDAKADLVLGHEFCAEVMDYGPATQPRLKPGTRVVSLPFAIGPEGPELVGFSSRFPGGFAEQMLLTESLLLEVPNGLQTDYAAMVEPMAVGAHAIAQADLADHPVILVIGCGPVGLAVIAGLKAKGIGPVVASDYAPERRRIAEIMGADIVIDPANTSPHAHWQSYDVPASLAELGIAQMMGRSTRRAVIFECVGVAGLLQSLIEYGPPAAQIIVVGACMTEDRIVPFLAINKQLTLKFVFAYTATEFHDTLLQIADGSIDVSPMVSGTVGRSRVAEAFAELSGVSGNVKIFVDPAAP